MINRKNKKAFSMITAIFVIVMMATLTALIQSITGKTIKATTQQYQKEQATLLARSYTELAVLYVSSYDRSVDCLNTINAHFGDLNNGYDIEIEIRYIGKESELVNCETLRRVASLNGGATFDQSMSLIIDTYVEYKDFDDPSDRNITFHRRTLQKI
jgi:type II secretory pathway pseudopilin PulG